MKTFADGVVECVRLHDESGKVIGARLVGVKALADSQRLPDCSHFVALDQFGLVTGWSLYDGYVRSMVAGESTLLCTRGHVVAGDNAKVARGKMRCWACHQARKRFSGGTPEMIAEADRVYAWRMLSPAERDASKQASKQEKAEAAAVRDAERREAAAEQRRVDAVARRDEKIANPPAHSLSVMSPDAASRILVFHPALVSAATSGVKAPFLCADGKHAGVAGVASVEKRAKRPNACSTCNNQSIAPGFNTLWERNREIASRILIVDPSKFIGSGDRWLGKAPVICDEHPGVANVVRLKSACEYNDLDGRVQCGICSRTSLAVGVNTLAAEDDELASRVLIYDPHRVIATNSLDQVPVICDDHSTVANVRSMGRLRKGVEFCQICERRVAVPDVNTVAVTDPDVASRMVVVDPNRVTHTTVGQVPLMCDAHLSVATTRWLLPHPQEWRCGMCKGNKRAHGVNMPLDHMEKARELWADPRDPGDVKVGHEVCLKCPSCDSEWVQKYGSTVRCYECNPWMRRETLAESPRGAWLYFDPAMTTDKAPGEILLHFGITRIGVPQRMSQHRAKGFIPSDAVEWVWISDGEYVGVLESLIKRETKNWRLPLGSMTGNYECMLASDSPADNLVDFLDWVTFRAAHREVVRENIHASGAHYITGRTFMVMAAELELSPADVSVALDEGLFDDISVTHPSFAVGVDF
jgi:hypothetical protein